MKRLFFYTAVLLLAIACKPLAEQQNEPVDYVNTLMGTMSKHSLSNGNTYPAVAMPWGMNFWIPQTGKMGDGWAYTYTADKIRGFKQTHQPSPWINDYGQFSLMPTTGELTFDEDQRASWFSHKAEEATPYYYKVYLADHDIVSEMAPTERAAMFRFTYPENDSSYLIVDAFDNGSYIKVIPEERKIIGYTTKNSGGVPENFKNYFVVLFDKDFEVSYGVDKGTLKESELEINSEHAGAIIAFKTKRGEQLHARVASSFISPEQAELNLNELANTFDEVKQEARDRWNDILGRINVEDRNIDNLRTFYSTLYRSVLFPRKLYEIDADGNSVHYSPHNGEILSGYMYTDTGFWDTFRSLFPFLNLVYPEINREIQEGFANTFLESNFLPEWASPGHRDCMVGNNSASVVADALLKDVTDEKFADVLWQAVVHGAHNVHPEISSTGRIGHEYYNTIGYVPYDVGINENAARTLEYAYNDWCIYQMGKKLNKDESELQVYAQRAMNYKNLYDDETKLMRGKNEDGSFMSPFNPLKWGDAFTEGNSWHYTWSVFHDPQGLIELMGGEEMFNNMLDSVFNVPPSFDESYYGYIIHEIREMQIMNMGNYAHGNQPAQHMVYLYNYSGEPWKAQQRSREVMEKLYNPNPDGYCGDEDNGQTSAWYVFSAMGFYPVCPGTDEYILGAPLFDKVEISLENGKKITILSENNNKENVYIQNMTLNGSTYSKNFLRYDDLINGAKIKFRMGPEANTKRGTAEGDKPYSFSFEIADNK